jgi:hypothetical protein
VALHEKSDEEKSTYAGLAQEIGYSPGYWLSLLRLVKCASRAPAGEECNK